MSAARRNVAALAILAASTAPAAAQGPGGTEIYLARLTDRGGTQTLSEPLNITRRVGYDNQPSFSPDGLLVYYTSYRDGQTDTYLYVLADRTTRQVTNTPESEYSPTVTPAGDRFSVVRVEQDSTQRLWTFALDGSDPQLLIATVAPVGYYTWLAHERVAMFVLGTPNTLRIWAQDTPHAISVAADIGRTLTRDPRSADLTFIQHDESGESWITVRETASGEFRRITRTPANEFFAWTPDGTLLSGDGSKVFAFRPGDASWREIADYTSTGLTGITRIAVSPDGTHVAFVAAEGS